VTVKRVVTVVRVPPLSVAEQLTVVVPTGNTAPDAEVREAPSRMVSSGVGDGFRFRAKSQP
jgi:hypothetical protein